MTHTEKDNPNEFYDPDSRYATMKEFIADAQAVHQVGSLVDSIIDRSALARHWQYNPSAWRVPATAIPFVPPDAAYQDDLVTRWHQMASEHPQVSCVVSPGEQFDLELTTSASWKTDRIHVYDELHGSVVLPIEIAHNSGDYAVRHVPEGLSDQGKELLAYMVGSREADEAEKESAWGSHYGLRLFLDDPVSVIKRFAGATRIVHRPLYTCSEAQFLVTQLQAYQDLWKGRRISVQDGLYKRSFHILITDHPDWRSPLNPKGLALERIEVMEDTGSSITETFIPVTVFDDRRILGAADLVWFRGRREIWGYGQIQLSALLERIEHA